MSSLFHISHAVDVVFFSRSDLGRIALAIAEDEVSDADVVALDTPFLEKGLPFFAFKFFFCAVDPAGIHTDGVRGVHHIAKHQTAVLNAGAHRSVGKHNDDGGRAVKGIILRKTSIVSLSCTATMIGD